jgi:phosphohistidine phosphatase SixA
MEMETIKYCMMRHAAYYDLIDEFITLSGIKELEKSIKKLKDELELKYFNKKLCIIYSSLPRARNTTLLIKDLLKSSKRETILRLDTRLNSNRLSITKEYIKEVVSFCNNNNAICLILSHQSDIFAFCGKDLDNSQYIINSIEIEKAPNDGLSF